MKILLVAATETEIMPLLEELHLLSPEPQHLKKARYHNLDVEVLITGVGMTATAFYLGQTLVSVCDYALNLGLAGSFNRMLELGDVVQVIEDRFSELGAEDGDSFIPISEMNLGTGGVVHNDRNSENPVIELIPKVTGITVNTVHGNEKHIDTVCARFHPYTESMEGAAFLFGCKVADVPCAQLRSVSNYVERRNRKAWNIPLAVKTLNQKAIEILNAFAGI